jgi:hypothetical protein
LKGQLRIDQMYAFIVLDDDGTEGIPAVPGPFGSLPLVGADMARVEDCKHLLRQYRTLFKDKPITLARFSQRENLEVIEL